MRIGQTSFVVFLSTLASSALGFVATLYFARFLGAEVLGYYALITVVVKWIRLGGEVGVASAVNKRISEGAERSEFFTAGLVVVTAFGVVSSILVFIFQDTVNAFVGTSRVESAYFVVALTLFGLFSSVVMSTLKGERIVHISVFLSSPVQVGLRSLLQIGLVIAGFELFGMLFGHLVAVVVVGVVGILYLSSDIAVPEWRHFRSLFNYAKYSWLGNIKNRSFSDVDTIVLGALVAPSLVGIYSVAWNLTNFIGTFSSSINKTTFPEMSKANAEDRREQISNVVTDSIAYSGLIAIPGLLGAAVVGDRLLRIYGDEFSQGATVLVILILAMLVYDYQTQLTNALNALDRPDKSFRVGLLFIIINILLNVALVSWIGWVGAAIATAISAAITVVLSLRYLQQILEFEIPYRELARQVCAATVMALLVTGLRRLIESNDVLDHNFAIVLLIVGAGAGVYFMMMLTISSQFRSTIADNAPITLPYIS